MIRLLTTAAPRKDCKMKLFIGDKSGQHSLKGTGGNHIAVEAKVMDTIIRQHGVKRVNWLKIDAEGAELEVLQGLRNTLKKDAPKIIMEVMNFNENSVKELLQIYGYTVIPIEGLEGTNFSYFYCEK